MQRQNNSLRQVLPTFLLLLLLLLLEAPSADAASQENQVGSGIAYLRVGSGESAYENYCAYTDPKLAVNLNKSFQSENSKPMIDAYPSDGCSRTNSSYKDRVVILARGHCTYSEKAVNAFLQGAAGLIVVSSERYSPYILAESPHLPNGFQTVVVSKVAYQSFKSQFMPSPLVRGTLYRPYDDPSGSKQYMFLVLYAIAMATMFMSCITAATTFKQHLLSRARFAGSSNPNSESGPEVDSTSASWWQTMIFICILIAIPITILLLLNYVYDYFVWVMLVLYGYSVASSLVYYANRIYLMSVQAQLETGPRPWLATIVECDLGKCCGKISYTYLEFIAYPFGLAVAVVWFVFRNSHWAFILTNILNVVLVMRVIESLVFALRIKIATIILICFLVYDVFFVFITPLFSGGGSGGGGPSPTNPPPTPSTLSRVRRDTIMDYYIERDGSIMERVALGTAGLSGEIIPIVFKVMPYPPVESITTCLLPYSILGLGDVILPAILISLNLFFDLAWSNRCWPYFISSMIGYLLGLGACAGVLFATGKGQPALLYIVPLILITSYLCAAIRREAKMYFNTGLPDEYRVNSRFELDSAGQRERQVENGHSMGPEDNEDNGDGTAPNANRASRSEIKMPFVSNGSDFRG